MQSAPGSLGADLKPPARGLRPAAQGQRGEEGSAAPRWSVGGGLPVPSLHTAKHRAADARQMGVGGSHPQMAGGQAVSPELLNKATSALPLSQALLEQGLGVVGWGGGVRRAPTTAERMSATPPHSPYPKWGRTQPGKKPRTEKPLHTHSLMNFYSWRERARVYKHKGTQGPWASVLERKARPPAMNLDSAQRRAATGGLLHAGLSHTVPTPASPYRLLCEGGTVITHCAPEEVDAQRGE